MFETPLVVFKSLSWNDFSGCSEDQEGVGLLVWQCRMHHSYRCMAFWHSSDDLASPLAYWYSALLWCVLSAPELVFPKSRQKACMPGGWLWALKYVCVCVDHHTQIVKWSRWAPYPSRGICYHNLYRQGYGKGNSNSAAHLKWSVHKFNKERTFCRSAIIMDS